MSANNSAYQIEYKKEHYDKIGVYAPKDKHIPELVNQAVSQGLAESKSQYILMAIKNKLKEDGIW